jgi:heme/copper-type cytochrome/quinol oxidase subunit 3
MTPRPALDVSHLPPIALDDRAPLWWGSVLMLVIETTMFAIVIASYFYLRMNFDVWPPPRTEPPTTLDTNPDLAIGTVALVVMLAGCVPMIFVDRAARRGEQFAVQVGLVICVLFGLVQIVLRALEFPAFHFWWDSNAYGSIVWTTLGLHLGHMIATLLEVVLPTVWVFLRGLDEKHALDITIAAIYWYWVAAIWVPAYAVLYFGPRLL